MSRFIVVTDEGNMPAIKEVHVEITVEGEKVITGFCDSTTPHVLMPAWQVPWKDVKQVIDTKYNKNIKTVRGIKFHGAKHIDTIKNLGRIYSIKVQKI